MLQRLVNDARFGLVIEATGPLLVKSGHPTISGPDMTPVQVFRNDRWEFYIPGSSLKGVIRSHLERVTRTLNDSGVVACNPFGRIQDGPLQASCGARFQAQAQRNGRLANEQVYRESCAMCRLFGSAAFGSRVAIGDAYLMEGSPSASEFRDGVGIDRLTGGAANRAKFDLQAVSPGARFMAPIVVRNFEVWQLGALLLAVNDIADGLIAVGSGRSRGFGAIKGWIDAGTDGAEVGQGLAISYIGLAAPIPAVEVWGLGKFLRNGAYGTEGGDALRVAVAPMALQRGVRSVTTFAGGSLDALVAAAMPAFVSRVRAWQVPPAPQVAPPESPRQARAR